MADPENTNNITGFKDKRIDEITEKYDVEFDAAKREALLRELDSILTNQYQYIMEWYPPAERIAYWNKFGMPQGVFSRVADFEGTIAPGLPQLWWIDPVKSEQLNKAMANESMKLEIPPVEERYWQEYGKKQSSQPKPGGSGGTN